MVYEIALALPFSLDPYKKVSVTSDQRKIWSDRVRSVIGTSLRERVLRPSFGTTVPFAMFETQTSAEAEVQVEIEKAFSTQLPLLTLQDINVSFNESLNTIRAEVVYAIPNDTIVTTEIGYVILQGKLPLFEEML